MQIHKKYQSFLWGSPGISEYENHSVHHTLKDLYETMRVRQMSFDSFINAWSLLLLSGSFVQIKH